MGATVAFTDLGGLAGTSFPEVGELEDERFTLNRKLAPSTTSKAIVGKSAALRKVLDQVCDCRADRINRAASRRNGHRQGTRCPGHS